MTMNETKILEYDECFLRLCPYMAGMQEAWLINKIVYVSPALFQLLTDEDDFDTANEVARNLLLKSATYTELEILAKKHEGVGSYYNGRDVIMHFK